MNLNWALLLLWMSFCAFGNAFGAETKEKPAAPPALPQTLVPPAASGLVPVPAGAVDDALADDDDEDDDDEGDVLSTGQANAIVADDDADDEDDDDEDEADPSKISGNVTLASDYILRGLSQTDHQPALQGGFDWNHPAGISLGVWGSNVRYADSVASLELDFSGGYTYQFSDSLSASLGILYFAYYDDVNRNSVEIPLKVQWKVFQLELDYSPGWEGDGQAWYLLAGWSDKVIWDVKAGLFVGYSIFTDELGGSNYVDFRASLSREFLDVEWAVTGVFLNQQEVQGAPGGPQAVVSVSKSF